MNHLSVSCFWFSPLFVFFPFLFSVSQTNNSNQPTKGFLVPCSACQNFRLTNLSLPSLAESRLAHATVFGHIWLSRAARRTAGSTRIQYFLSWFAVHGFFFFLTAQVSQTHASPYIHWNTARHWRIILLITKKTTMAKRFVAQRHYQLTNGNTLLVTAIDKGGGGGGLGEGIGPGVKAMSYIQFFYRIFQWNSLATELLSNIH